MKYLWLMTSLLCSTLLGQTIKEKKESFHKHESGLDLRSEEELRVVNDLLAEKKICLQKLYEQAQAAYLLSPDEENCRQFLREIQAIKTEILETEEMWRDRICLKGEEGYSLWHQPESTINQFIMDYGSGQFLYLIPQEISALRISVQSQLPIPKESRDDCLELILTQNGIGIRKLSPYVRELYLLRQDLSYIKCITSDPKDLPFIPQEERICFVLSPDSPDPTGALNFLQKFSSPASTNIELIRHDIYIISQRGTIQELLKLYDFFKAGKRGDDYQLVSLTKVEASSMISILESAFFASGKKGKDELMIIPLQNSLFLFGTKDELAKACNLIRDVESQIEDPKEKTLFWYTAKHSDAEELATLLAKVYDLLIGENKTFSSESGKIQEVINQEKENQMVVKPQIVAPPTSEERVNHRTADGQNNFIVDPKTGSIIMVVEQEALFQIKDLLKKLDVPKKMVQIEVLLFEKKVSKQNKFGLNLLKIGSQAADKAKMAFNWTEAGVGILEFLISHNKGSAIPSFDVAYKFLLGQEDVQINASPSILAVNQTPATIAIVEEISINTGSESDDKKVKTHYSRAQYGITLQITPTINVGDDCEDEGFVTLDTDITFDTTTRKNNDRPDVTRRHVKNHVRIADGQTVILGGLRRKISEDNRDSIPFLGEIPGLGKLFSMTDLNDSNTEMFLFITPKIIYDPVEDLEKLKKEELVRRVGDTPEFLKELEKAKLREKKRVFEGGLTALFGRLDTDEKPARREYDGR